MTNKKSKAQLDQDLTTIDYVDILPLGRHPL